MKDGTQEEITQTDDRSLESIEKIFEEIRDIHKKNPNLRLGQIITSCFLDLRYIFYIENTELLKKIKKFYEYKRY